MKSVVVIGGGTGTFVVLSGLKKYDYDISAIVTTTDSGGSTGRLRDQYGALPPGDVRQCLVALSEAPEIWRKLFLYRFDKGDFKGHNFGNIFLTALEQIAPDYNKVMDMASRILQTDGEVLPVTYDKVHLAAEYQDGEVIVTEDLIDTAFHKDTRIKKAYLKPKARANKRALDAISHADYIIVGPGDIYTSIVPNLLVSSMKARIKGSKAKIIYVSNLMTKRGQTPRYSVMDHIHDLEKYLGKNITYIVLNKNPIKKDIVEYYEKWGESAVVDDVLNSGYKVIRKDILSTQTFKQNKGDSVMRSILRHDSDKLAHVLHGIIK